jgi:predicted  nucleic acid-binding Zn-ribbon protein
MTDAPKSLDDQLQDQREQLETTIKDLEAQIMRAKEAYLKILGAQEFSAIQKQQAAAAEENTTTEVVDP